MGTVGIVALSILAGLFLGLILLLAAGLIWLFFRARRILTGFQESMKQDLDVIRAALELQQAQIVTAVQKLNGEELSQAARASTLAAQAATSAARRIENAALAIGELIIPGEIKKGTGLAPEEYAQPEPGEQFVGRSRTAALDEADERDEGRSVTEGL